MDDEGQTLDRDGNVDIEDLAQQQKYRFQPKKNRKATNLLAPYSSMLGNQNAKGHSGGYSLSKFDERFLKEALVMAKGGLTEHEIADAFQISVTTLQLWKKDHPELAVALIEGRAIWDDRIEASLAQSAIGYSHPAVQIMLDRDGCVHEVEYTKHYPPNVAAANVWLANRKQKEWGAAIGENTPQHQVLKLKLEEMATKIDSVVGRIGTADDEPVQTDAVKADETD